MEVQPGAAPGCDWTQPSDAPVWLLPGKRPSPSWQREPRYAGRQTQLPVLGSQPAECSRTQPHSWEQPAPCVHLGQAAAGGGGGGGGGRGQKAEKKPTCCYDFLRGDAQKALILISFSGRSQWREQKCLFVEEESNKNKKFKSNTQGVTYSSVEAQ